MEHFVPSGCISPSGQGKADMVHIDAFAMRVQVYEIKPASHLNTNSPAMVQQSIQDNAQLQGYVNGLKLVYPDYNVKRGTTYASSLVSFPSVFYPGRDIIYTNPLNGIIYYDYRKRDPEREKEPATQPRLAPYGKRESEREPNTDLGGVVAAGLILVFLGGVIAAPFSGGSSLTLSAAALALLAVPPSALDNGFDSYENMY